MAIQCAHRVDAVEEYYFSKKNKEIAQMRQEGKDVISLGIGSPDLAPSPESIVALCDEAKKDNVHGYQSYTGIPELREAFADFYKRWYGVSLNPKTEIQPLIGSKEGILHITLAFVNVGDKVLVPNPGYPTYTSLSRLLGAEVIPYDLDENNGWQPNWDALEKMDLTGVKMMWVNYPNMPTGAPATLALFHRLVDFARRHTILLVNDNPYSLILNRNPLSIMQVEGAKEWCLEFNSMSKSHNMAGWRVGMVAGKKEYIEWILKVKSNIDSGMFRPVQMGAVAALHNSPEWHERMNICAYQKRRAVAEQIMDALHCTYDKNQVGLFVWGRIPEHYAKVEDLTELLLHKALVFLTPGFIFGSNGERYVRISLCATEDKLTEALHRIEKVVNK